MVAKPGTMLSFVAQHANVGRDVNLYEEAQRLMPLIEGAGHKTTIGSVRQCLTVIRKRKGLSVPKVKPKAAARIQQNPRALALESYLEDAMKGLSLLKGEIKRLKEIEKKYLGIKAQFDNGRL